VNLDLIGVQAKLNSRSVGNLAVRLMKPREGAALAISEIHTGTATIGSAFGDAGEVVEAGGGILEQVSPIASAITSALESVTAKLEIIVKIGDQIATVRLRAHGFPLGLHRV
jgi:phage-related minor tail protein